MKKLLAGVAVGFAWFLGAGVAHEAVLIANWRFDLLDAAHWAYVRRGFGMWWDQGVALRWSFLAVLSSAIVVPLGGAVWAARWAYRRAGHAPSAPKTPTAEKTPSAGKKAGATSAALRTVGRFGRGVLRLVLRPLTGSLPRVQLTITIDPPAAITRPPQPAATVVARPAPAAELQTRARRDIGMRSAKAAPTEHAAAAVEPAAAPAAAQEPLPAAPPPVDRPSRSRRGGSSTSTPEFVQPAAEPRDAGDGMGFAEDGAGGTGGPVSPAASTDYQEIAQEMNPEITTGDIAAILTNWLRTNGWAVRDDIHVDAGLAGAFSPDAFGDDPQAVIPVTAVAPHQIWLIFPVSLEGRTDWLAADWQAEPDEPPVWMAYEDEHSIPCPIREAVRAVSRFWDHHGDAARRLQALQPSAVRAIVVMANGQLRNHDEIAPSWAAVEDQVTVVHLEADDDVMERVFGGKLEGNPDAELVKRILDDSNALVRAARKRAA